MEGLSLTFEQYNFEQERLTKRFQERQAKNRDVRRHPKMKKSEVQERLDKLGVQYHWESLKRWEREGLLPKSKKVGREKDYPDGYTEAAFAVLRLKNSYMRLRNRDVMQAKDTVEQALKLKETMPHVEVERLIQNIIREKLRAERGDLTNFRKLIEWMEDAAVFWHWMISDADNFSETIE